MSRQITLQVTRFRQDRNQEKATQILAYISLNHNLLDVVHIPDPKHKVAIPSTVNPKESNIQIFAKS